VGRIIKLKKKEGWEGIHGKLVKLSYGKKRSKPSQMQKPGGGNGGTEAGF